MTTADTQASVEKTRARTGLTAVVTGDVVIALAAILGVLALKDKTTPTDSIVAVLSSGFTAIGTLTTAYFGIKATANTATTSLAANTAAAPTSAAAAAAAAAAPASDPGKPAAGASPMVQP